MLQSIGLQRVRHDLATKHQPWPEKGLPAAFYPEAPIGDKGVLSLPHITYPPYIAGWVSSIRWDISGSWSYPHVPEHSERMILTLSSVDEISQVKCQIQCRNPVIILTHVDHFLPYRFSNFLSYLNFVFTLNSERRWWTLLCLYTESEIEAEKDMLTGGVQITGLAPGSVTRGHSTLHSQ